MDWIIIAVTVLLFFAYLFLRRKGQISAEAALQHLRHGALLIDVRDPVEYQTAHLDRAINIPLAEIETAIPSRVEDKNQVLLVHCQSGTRSGIARNKLAALGYTRVYNLGSYDRAAHLVSEL
jgi:rhodanese-related sulfurtransferase